KQDITTADTQLNTLGEVLVSRRRFIQLMFGGAAAATLIVNFPSDDENLVTTIDSENDFDPRPRFPEYPSNAFNRIKVRDVWKDIDDLNKPWEIEKVPV